ncbi:C39 family peptidase [Qipengyuania spongiae]|uniref:C39 family peptidase n=1 Tax=Qipengyuania spongiae TaxID=2909673 RepID=A0ABY5T238_9SPHN|nr:C39 family peptidase [Qipengyuania spongiae]UVI39579.1 C39 family peptidase [Qipengyuania spongiae]
MSKPPRRRVLIAAPLATALLASAVSASAQVRLQHDSGGTFDVAVMSWWEIPFRSVVRQRYDFSCGSAAIATLLTYHYDRSVSERDAFTAMWQVGDRDEIRKRGFSLLDMRSYLISLGYEAEGFRLTVDQLAKVRRPLIALIDLHGYKHFVVIKGMRGDRVLTGDPTLGLTEYAADDFAKHWEGVALAVMRTPDRVLPTYNLSGDWGPWSRAPIEQGGALRVASSDLTNDLPPDYQITPEMLIPVRIGTVE